MKAYRSTPENRARAADAQWRRYGIEMTVVRYQEMLRIQGGVCAICGASPNGKPLDVDHDHSDGRVRGLLCVWCNRHLLPQVERVGPDKMPLVINYIRGPQKAPSLSRTKK